MTLSLRARARSVAALALFCLASAWAPFAAAQQLSIADVSITEGNSGSKAMTFTVKMSAPKLAAVLVDVATSNGSAMAGSDYLAASTLGLRIPAGTTSKAFTVSILGDTVAEANETFAVNLSNPVGATISDAQAIGTISNDDTSITPGLSIRDAYVYEGDSGTQWMEFTVALSALASTDVTYTIASADGSATAGSDYVAIAPTVLTISAGAEMRFTQVQINNDIQVEDHEQFSVSISNVSGATILDAQGIGTIYNNDYTPTVSVEDVLITEGDAGTQQATFTVSLSRTPTSDVSFSVGTSDGTATAGSDYVALALANQVIPAGQTSKDFTVTINGDTAVESNEYFNFSVDNVTGAAIAVGSAHGVIVSDDLPSLSVGDVTITEGDAGSKLATFTISLSVPGTEEVFYQLGTVDQTAQAGSDYLAIGGLQSIPAGASSQIVNVEIIGDTDFEADETFAVVILDQLGATVADGEAIATISNDDAPPPEMSVADVSITEGDYGTKVATFTISLNKPAKDTVVFDIGTTWGTAEWGSDFESSFPSISIPIGATSATFSVTIKGDTDHEPDETFSVDITYAWGATVLDGHAVGTIVNDDAPPTPNIAVGGIEIYEGDSGTKTATIYVGMNIPSANPVTFDFATGGYMGNSSDAQPGVDYVAKSVIGVTIPAGQTSTTIDVLINGDTTEESNEYFDTIITNAVGANIAAGGKGRVTILNDDQDTPWLSVGDATITEGNSGTKTATVTVSLNKAVGLDVSYDITTFNNTASAGSDYVSKTLTGEVIPAGQTSRTFSFEIIGDTAFETDETVRAQVYNLWHANAAKNTGYVTITNDDVGSLPTLSVGDVSVTEGNSGTKTATFTVSLSAAALSPVSFDVMTLPGTAQTMDDLAWVTLTNQQIPVGQSSTTVSVPIYGDTYVEQDETYTVNVSNVVGATPLDPIATGTIINDDLPTPTLSISSMVISPEGNSGTTQAVFTLQLSAPASTDVTYDIATINNTATAPSDFVAASLVGQTIPAGQTSKTFSVVINGDTAVEFDEVYVVDVSNVVGAVMPNNQGIGKIRNDDGVPTLSIGDVTISEGNSGTKMANFTLSLSAASATHVFVDINTADGTAAVGSDYYEQRPQGFMIAAGQTSANLAVEIIGDTTNEANETFTVNLSNPVNATIADAQAVGTITNDDSAGGPTLSIGDVTISEGNSLTKTATFTVTLSAVQTAPVFFDAATANGTATAGSDYVAKALTGQRIPIGATAKTFLVTINGDTASEPNETFTVNLSNVTGGGVTLADGQAVGTITNDDAVATPSLSIGDVSIAEGNAGTSVATFTVSLSPAAAGNVTYDIATANGTATSGSDFVASSLVGQTITAGQTSKTFAVTINGDTTSESNETFTVNLTNVVGATLGDGSATGTITNDDSGGGGTPTLSIADISFAEGNSLSKQVTFTVTLSAAATSAVTYTIATANGTALSPGDYTAKSLTGQSIPAGTLSKTFAVAIKGDKVVEPNETFLVNVSAVTGATVADGSATGTITNDDAAALTVARFDARGLVDDIDDGNKAPQVSTQEYAMLLLDTAKGVCERTQGATIVGIDGVENRNVLTDLADAANGLCTGEPRYAAVMEQGASIGFLVEATAEADARGVQVLTAPTSNASAGLTSLSVQAAGHARPLTVLLPQALPTQAAARTAQLKSLGAAVQTLAKDPEARLVLIGGVTVKPLLDLSTRDLPKVPGQAAPTERVLVSAALLQEFGQSRVEFLPVPAKAAAQVLQLQR